MSPVDRWSLELRVSLWMIEKNKQQAWQEYAGIGVVISIIFVLWRWV